MLFFVIVVVSQGETCCNVNVVVVNDFDVVVVDEGVFYVVCREKMIAMFKWLFLSLLLFIQGEGVSNIVFVVVHVVVVVVNAACKVKIARIFKPFLSLLFFHRVKLAEMFHVVVVVVVEDAFYVV